MEVKLDKERDKEQYAHKMKGKSGIRRVGNALLFSWAGLSAAYANEAAFRQIVWFNLALASALIFVPLVLMVKMVLVLASCLSVIVELINTGLEAAIDHTSTDQHPLAKIGKDVGSAAQLLMLCALVLLWGMALWSCYGTA